MSTQIADMSNSESDYVSAVTRLTQMIRTECAEVDRTRRIPAVVVDALRDAGVFRMLAPRATGGAETDPLSFLRVVEEVSYADGSVGWCTMIGGSYATFGGMLPPQGARELFGDTSTIQPADAIFDRVARRQQQYWCPQPLASQLTAHLQAIAPRQHDVEHHHVIRGDFGECLAVLAVIRHIDRVARFDQAVAQRELEPAVVFDEEQSHDEPHCAAAR
jgi:hypothetical protein